MTRRRAGRAAAGLLCAFVVLLATGLATGRQFAAAGAARQRVAHAERVLAALDQLELSVTDAETGQRGYLLTHRREYLAPYRSAGAGVDSALRWLRDSTTERPALQLRVDSLERLAHARLALLDAAIVLDDAGRADAALTLVRTGRGAALMTQLRGVLTHARADERRLLDGRRQDASAADAALRLHLVTLALLGTAAAALTALVLRRDARQLAVRTAEAVAAAGAAREAETHARELFEGSASVQLLFDAGSGAVVDVNAAAEAFYGWPRETMRRMRVGHVAGLTPDAFQALVAELAARGPTVARQRHRRRVGDVRDVDAFVGTVRVAGRTLVHASVHDVTDRLHAEAALSASEARFRAAVDGSTDAFFLLTPLYADGAGAVDPVTDFEVAEVNVRGAALLGTFAGDLLGVGLCALFPLARDTGVLARCVRALVEREPAEFEHEVRDPRVTAQWLLIQVSPVRAPDGTVTAVALAARDITEVKAAQARLRDSEARYRLLFESMPRPSWVYDTETLGFLAVNPAAVNHYGWSAEEFAELTLADLLPAEDRTALRAWVADGDGRVVTDAPQRHLTRDGRLLEVEISSHPLVYDGRPGRLVLVDDVTQRLALLLAVRQCEAFADGVLEASPDCVKTLDLDGRLQTINGNGRCLLELDDPCALVGQEFATLFPAAADQEAVRAVVAAARAGGSGRVQAPAPTAKGTPRWWDVVVTPIVDVTGAPGALLAVSRDITGARGSGEVEGGVLDGTDAGGVVDVRRAVGVAVG